MGVFSVCNESEYAKTIIVLSKKANLQPEGWLNLYSSEFNALLSEVLEQSFLEDYHEWYKIAYIVSSMANCHMQKRGNKVTPDDLMPKDWKDKYKEILKVNTPIPTVNKKEKLGFIDKLKDKIKGR